MRTAKPNLECLEDRYMMDASPAGALSGLTVQQFLNLVPPLFSYFEQQSGIMVSAGNAINLFAVGPLTKMVVATGTPAQAQQIQALGFNFAIALVEVTAVDQALQSFLDNAVTNPIFNGG